MGRPPKKSIKDCTEKEMEEKVILSVKVTRRIREESHVAAKLNDMSLSDWCNDTLNQKLKKARSKFGKLISS